MKLLSFLYVGSLQLNAFSIEKLYTLTNIYFQEQELDEISKKITEKTAALGKITDEIKIIKSNINDKENQMSQLRNSTKGLEDRIQALKVM